MLGNASPEPEGWWQSGLEDGGERRRGMEREGTNPAQQLCIRAPFPSCFGEGQPAGGAEQSQGCCPAPPAVAPALNPPATAPGSPALGGDGLASRFPDFPRQHVLFMTPRSENETEIRGGRRGERGSRRVATTARGAISLQGGGQSRPAREELSCPAWGSHLHPPKYNRPGNKQELVFVSVHK